MDNFVYLFIFNIQDGPKFFHVMLSALHEKKIMFSYFRAKNILTPFDQEKLQAIHLYIIQFESDKSIFSQT